MSVLATVGKFFGGLLFSIGLGTLILAMALAQFTEYTSLKPVVAEILAKEISKQPTGDQLAILKTQCEGGKETVEVPMDQPIGTLELKCAEVSSSTVQTFPTTLANAIFDKIYYKKYSCDFLQCLSNLDGNERFTIIITELGNRFFASSILPLAAATAAGIVLLAVSIRTWYGIAKSIGVTCIIVGLPYFTFPLLEQMLTGSQFATTEQSAAIQPILAKVFEPMKMNFLLVFIFGVVLAVVGFVGGYFVTRSQKKVVNEEKRK
ncbi:MAG TPA: hypothetical protein VJJ76_00330 [archaeon]|nr:hypothetical protein [archaeon]